MVEGMNISEEEIIQILMEHIHPSEWASIDLNLSIERAKEVGDEVVDNVHPILFPCGLADILLLPNGEFYDAHPHI